MSADDSLSATEHCVRDIAERYVDELDSKLSTRDLEAVLHGEKGDLASRDLGSKPETHVQNNFVYPLLDAMGLACTGGGGYWLNAVPESIHGEDATTIDELYFDDELTQKTVFLIVNWSTSYVYWVIYGSSTSSTPAISRDSPSLKKGCSKRTPARSIDWRMSYGMECRQCIVAVHGTSSTCPP
jgi:hypothetical protein